LEESQHPGNPASKRPAAKALAIRTLVGVILIPVVLAVTYAGGPVFALFVGGLAAVGSFELFALASKSGFRPGRVVGVLGSAAVAAACYSEDPVLPALIFMAGTVVVVVERMVRSTRERYLSDAAVTALALAYPGWLLGSFVWLRNPPSGVVPGIQSGRLETGVVLVYLVLIVTWSYDSIAYLSGSALGRHKLLSRISPSKTVEGTAGGLLGSAAAALVCRAAFASFLGLGEAVILGLALGAAAQIGDVVESMFKRSAGAKDSSNLIPGHGGFLDRVDSLLFTGPVFFIYARIAWF
jgi:phosphatidate cytidylyltransferase